MNESRFGFCWLSLVAFVLWMSDTLAGMVTLFANFTTKGYFSFFLFSVISGANRVWMARCVYYGDGWGVWRENPVCNSRQIFFFSVSCLRFAVFLCISWSLLFFSTGKIHL